MVARLGGSNLENRLEPSNRSLTVSPVSLPPRHYRRSFPPPPTWVGEGVCDMQKNRWLIFSICSLFCTATMIQGPSDAVVHASFPQIEVSISCALNSGMADCIGQVQQPGMTITTSIRESMKPYLVQGGGPDGGSPGPTPAPTQTGSNSNTGNSNGSSLTTGVMDLGVLVGGVVAGIIATFFMV